MNMSAYEGFKTADELTPWEKVYWYLRILIDTDRYGALGRKLKKISLLQNNLLAGYARVAVNEEDKEAKTKILSSILKQTLEEGQKADSGGLKTMTNLQDRLNRFLVEPIDYLVFALTIKELLLPTNEAIETVPSQEITDFAHIYAKAVLETKKEQGLATLIREWDSLTEDLALNREREIINELFGKIKQTFKGNLGEHKIDVSDPEMDSVLTAVCQEFERRVGQKRKQRAGKDLEGATEFIFGS